MNLPNLYFDLPNLYFDLPNLYSKQALIYPIYAIYWHGSFPFPASQMVQFIVL